MRRAAALLILTLMAAPAPAVKLDDSMSPRQRVDTQLQWTHDIPMNRRLSRAEMNALHTRIPGFEIRLSTAAYVGRTVQIYLGIPVQVQGLKSPAGMRIEWQTRGLFSAGATQPGSRALIFQGVVPSAMMSEVFDFTIKIDGQHLDGRLQFDPQFELEIIK
jgi:hypothetical protein